MPNWKLDVQPSASHNNSGSRPKLSRGLSILTGATVIAGLSGYLVTWLVYRHIGPASYALFAIFWSAMYLLIGGISGIQQEVTRSSHPRKQLQDSERGVARTFAMVAAVGIAIVILLSSPLWTPLAFGASWLSFTWPLALSVASYAVVAVISGSLYGVSRWGTLGLMISIDAVLRLILVGMASLWTESPVVLAWGTAAPIFLTPVILFFLLRRGLSGKVVIDVSLGRLTWNSTRTVIAAFSTAVLVSGFPLILGMTSQQAAPALIGELIFVITLTRAPLIILLTAFQSLLVVQFRDNPAKLWRFLGRVSALVLAVTIVLALLGFFLGRTAFELLTGHEVTVTGLFIAVLVVSSALVALMTLAGAALLARSQHLGYTLGWVISAVATLVLLLVPIETLTRVALALVLAPLVGIISQLVALASVRTRQIPVRPAKDMSR